MLLGENSPEESPPEFAKLFAGSSFRPRGSHTDVRETLASAILRCWLASDPEGGKPRARQNRQNRPMGNIHTTIMPVSVSSRMSGVGFVRSSERNSLSKPGNIHVPCPNDRGDAQVQACFRSWGAAMCEVVQRS